MVFSEDKFLILWILLYKYFSWKFVLYFVHFKKFSLSLGCEDMLYLPSRGLIVLSFSFRTIATWNLFVCFKASLKWNRTTCTLLCFWFLSVSIFILKFIHVNVCINTCFFLLLIRIPLNKYITIFFIHSHVDGHLSSFWFWLF